MSDVRILPHAPRGKLAAPPSKSAAHRALICAALSAMPCRVFPVAASSDMRATLRVLRAMGVNWTQEEHTVVFEGASWQAREPFDCLESGSTLRFLLPVAAALGLPAAFTGGGRLPERPLGALMEQMRAHGVAFSDGRLPFSISGRLAAGRYTLPGDVSSQFISGLLFALPLVEGDSEIVLTSPLQSAGYVDMSLEALAQSGIRVSRTESGWQVPGGQAYRSGERTVEADWSNAAFWLCAGAAGGDVRLTGLRDGSAQGDRAVFDLIGQFGAQISRDANVTRCAHAPLHGIRIDAGPIPDLVPILAVTAAFAQGDTEIYNAGRLRIKESDRLSTVAALLRDLGGSVDEYPDRLTIHGGGLRGGTADGANDHRVVMSAAIAGMFCREPVLIRGAEAVHKSYPDFFEDFKKLGGLCDVI